jgi:hypothetical protein
MLFLDEKVFIALISVGTGWLLAQGTALIKDWWTARKLKSGLLNELEDIKEQICRIALIYERKIQIHSHKGIEPSVAIEIHNFFFKQYYKDVFSRLNRPQRLSYQLIHGSLDSINQKNEELKKFIVEAYKVIKNTKDQKVIAQTFEFWGDQVVAIYKSAKELQWHIEYHLKNEKHPVFDIMGPMHESYLKFQEELEKNVKRIIEQAKTLKAEDFNKIYDESFFAKPNPKS